MLRSVNYGRPWRSPRCASSPILSATGRDSLVEILHSSIRCIRRRWGRNSAYRRGRPLRSQKQTSSREGSMSALPLPAQRRTFPKEVRRPCKTRRFQLTGLLSRPSAAECAELKLLHNSPRRGVIVSARVDQLKAPSEGCGEGVRVVAADGQAAAALRAVEREGGDDGKSTRAQRASKPGNIGRLIVRLGEKMKRGPVVPHIIGPRRLPNGHVRRNPCYPACLVAQAGAAG